MKHLRNIQHNENGMVSITITVVFIMVISLTVLGFSQVSRRNSREALDRQLSSQAFYAAEVGVNDARNKIANLVEAGQPVPNQTECSDSGANGYTRSNGEVDQENGVYYSCLLVKSDLTNIRESNVGSGSVVIPLNAVSNDSGELPLLGEPTMKWKPSTDAAGRKVNDCKGPNAGGSQAWTNFPPASQWNSCPFGILRVDVVPNDTETVSRGVDEVLARTMTIFIYPAAGNVSVPPRINYRDTSNRVVQGFVVPAACSDTDCSLQLTGLSFQKAYLRIRSIYANTQMFEINAEKAPVGGGAKYTLDAQVEIDATGRAQDVLRRIQVRVSKTGGSSRTDVAGFSDYALQTADSICKRFMSSPVIGEASGDIRSGCTD